MGVRLHTLAKELGTSSKDLVARCRDRGIKVKSHLSSVPEPIAEVLRKEMIWRREREKAEREAAAARAAAAKDAPPAPQRPPQQDRGRPPYRDQGRPPYREQPRYPRGSEPKPPARDASRPPSRDGARPPRPDFRPTAPPKAVEPKRDEFGRVRRVPGQKDKPAETAAVSEAAKDKRVKSKGREHEKTWVRDTLVEPVEEPWRPPKKDQRDEHAVIFKPRRRGRDRHAAVAVRPERPKSVEIQVPISVRDFSSATGIKAGEILRALLLKGMAVSINDHLSEELVVQLGQSFSVEVAVKKPKTLEQQALEHIKAPDRPEDLVPRAPVVTFLGHVDHGKTSLLDRIRRTNVTAQEFGGITQHIGAYTVELQGKRIIFLDTPGHEAFTAMRARGANVTDVVVLVVAADDGVMPQTVEAINHAKAAGVPIVVALNKMDKPDANPSRVRQQLVEHDLTPHDWGGKTEVVEVSALTGKGIDELLELLLLEAELLELKANPGKPAFGTVLEAHLSEGKGVVATALVREGTLKRGDHVICGSTFGKVRAIYDDQGRDIEQAGPATPVELSGLDTVPEAGDTLQAVTDLQEARELAQERLHRRREEAIVRRKHVTLETLFSHLAEAKVKEARVIVKADVKGTVEVILKALNDLATKEVRVNALHAGVGAVTESDVLLADASDAVVIAFQVVPEERAIALAEEKGVEIRRYQVIYQAVDDMKKALEGLLEPEKKEVTVGHMRVTTLFKSSKYGTILGGKVTDGRLNRTDNIRVIRDGRIIHDGKVMSMRREKEDVREVQAGYECGVRLTNFDDVKEDDILEAYNIEKIARKL
ncbi:MAG TPA: translation initiation factor IF-2 [Planctomycetota bacterium]|nr:translation initiation factor IF-2 [Planctomycetota bacterium]